MKLILLILWVVLAVGCNNGNSSNDATKATTSLSGLKLPIPNNQLSNSYKIIFFGNSHVASMENLLPILIKSGVPSKEVYAQDSPNSLYLDERLNDKKSISALESQEWTHIIFQAQKYSQSGTVDYSTLEAKILIERAKQQNATPILFPEHSQKGDRKEGITVYELHKSIADDEPSCVAPVGYVWNRVLALQPQLALHLDDGNHASEAGRLLTALIFYEIITGEPADTLSYISELNVDRQVQALMGQIVSEVLSERAACDF
jgi:hypothetical protein